MYKHILVPTDGSKGAKRAGEHAIDLAKENGGAIHALYVMDMGDADFVATPSDIAETRSRLERKGKRFTDEIADMAAAAEVPCQTVVKSGIAPDEIVEYAEDNGIDVIVMGKRGRSDPDKPAIGSRTKRVIGMTNIPVQAV